MLKSRNLLVIICEFWTTFAKHQRILKLFEEKGLVHKIEDGSGIAKFALETAGENGANDKLHLHFHCSKCGETQCLTDQTIPNISLPKGFKATDANLVVKGLCDKCYQ